MSKLPLLRQFLNDRLIAAAEEIFGAVERIVLDLQDEVSRTKQDSERQRRILDAVIKPDLILHRIDPPLAIPPVPEEVPSEQQQHEQWFNVLQEDPETPRVKVENLWTSQEKGPFQELDTTDSTAPPSCGEKDSDNNVIVEMGPHHSPKVENRQYTNPSEDIDREHVGFKSSNDSQHLSAPIPDDFIEERQYQCNICGKCFKYRGSFKSHRLIHTGEKPYKCKECSSSFRYTGHLNRHKMTHRVEKPFKCKDCGIGFTKMGNLTFHKARHCGERPYQCKEKVCLNNHSRMHTMEKPHQPGEVYSEQKPHEQGLYVCQVQKDPEPLQIKEEDNFWTSQEMGEQFQGLDTTNSTAPPPCVERDNMMVEMDPYHSPKVEYRLYTNTNEDIVREQMGFEPSNDSLHLPAPISNGPIEERPYQCKVCGKCFKYKGNLKCHKLIHTGEKPYKCKDCSLSFRYKGHLNRHTRLHTGEKPYRCEFCDKSFTRNESLTFHIEHQHRELGFIVHRDAETLQMNLQQENVEIGQLRGLNDTDAVFPPPCVANACYQDLPQPSFLYDFPSVESRLCPSTVRDTKGGSNDEMDSQHPSAPIPNSPTDEKNTYQCELCGKCFKYKCNFNSHKLIHTGEKPYNCKDCSLSFRYKGHLNRHKRVHTGEKPYTCKICAKTFTRKESWAFHKSIHSGSDHKTAASASGLQGV